MCDSNKKNSNAFHIYNCHQSPCSLDSNQHWTLKTFIVRPLIDCVNHIQTCMLMLACAQQQLYSKPRLTTWWMNCGKYWAASDIWTMKMHSSGISLRKRTNTQQTAIAHVSSMYMWTILLSSSLKIHTVKSLYLVSDRKIRVPLWHNVLKSFWILQPFISISSKIMKDKLQQVIITKHAD